MKLLRTIQIDYRFALALLLVLLLLPTAVAYAGGIKEFFYELVVMVFGWLVGVGAMVLNYSLNFFVIGFGELYRSSLGVVDDIWLVVRDLFNLTFIFGLVYIGFKMILGIDDGQTRRWIVNLILAALLVNFSLFISKFVIDVSNTLAVSIMNTSPEIFQIGTGDNNLMPSPNNITSVDLSGSMQNATKIVTTMNESALEDMASQENGLDGPAGWVIIFGTMILFLVTAFVYFSAGILLLIRGVVLIILMMLSPFLFLGMVLPAFQSFSRSLWRKLFSRAFLAPIYILLLYLTLSVANSLIGDEVDFAGSFTPEPTTDTLTEVSLTFGYFIIVIILLVGSLVAASKLGAEGANKALAVGKSLRQGAQKRFITKPARALGRGAGAAAGAATVGLGAAATRRSLGRFAYNVGNSKKLNSGGTLARSVAAAGAKVGQMSFDPRDKKGGALGKGQKGGYAGTVKELEKKEKARAKLLEQNPYDENGNATAEFQARIDQDARYQEASNAKKLAQTNKEAMEAMVEEERTQFFDRDTELNSLKARLEGAATEEDRTNIELKIAAREGELRKEFNDENEELVKNLGQVNKTFKEAAKAFKAEETRLEGDHKYEYVDKLKERRDKEKQRWEAISGRSNVGQGARYATASTVGAVGGAKTGMMLGSAILPGFGTILGTIAGGIAGGATGAMTMGALNANVKTKGARVAQLTSEYGKDGRKKVKDKGKKDILDALDKQLKEAGGSKSDDGNKNEDKES